MFPQSLVFCTLPTSMGGVGPGALLTWCLRAARGSARATNVILRRGEEQMFDVPSH